MASFTTDFMDYATFFGRTSSNSQPASTANGTRFADANGDGYFFSREGNQLLVAAESIGNVSVTIELNEIDLKGYARLSGPLIVESDLDAALQSKIDNANAGNLTEAEARRIADEEIAKNAINADVVARKTVRFARPSQGEDIQINAALGFQIGTTNFVLGQITQDDDGAIIFAINNVGTRDQLRNYEIRVGDTTYDFSAMSYVAGSGANDGSSPDSYATGNGQPALSTTADTTLEILRPITANSYLPLEGIAGYAMIKTASGRHWAQVGTGGLEGRAVTSGKLAENAVENSNILDEAVSAAKIHTSASGSVDATSLDDGLGIITSAGSWTTRRYPVAHVTELISANLSGVSVPISSGDHRQQLRLISPNFDLDDANKQTGLVAVETRFTLSGRSSNSIGFDNSLSPQTTVRIGDFVSMSDLRGTTAYTTARAEGEIVASQDIFLGTTVLGTIRLFFAKETSTNFLGLYLDYVGASGQSHTYAIACRVLADYIPAGSA